MKSFNRKLMRENEFKRLVISTSKDSNIENIANQFQCYPDKLYFVIGNINYLTIWKSKINNNKTNCRVIIGLLYVFCSGNGSDDWLCLVEWLAQRGVLKIVVALETYSLTPKISRKFNILMNRYKGITVQLVPQSQLNTKESACSLVINTITTYPLGAIFFVSAVSSSTLDVVSLPGCCWIRVFKCYVRVRCSRWTRNWSKTWNTLRTKQPLNTSKNRCSRVCFVAERGRARTWSPPVSMHCAYHGVKTTRAPRSRKSYPS